MNEAYPGDPQGCADEDDFGSQAESISINFAVSKGDRNAI
jgi:hypothetical protein